MRYARLVKGAVTVTVTAATAVCHTLMTAGHTWAGGGTGRRGRGCP